MHVLFRVLQFFADISSFSRATKWVFSDSPIPRSVHILAGILLGAGIILSVILAFLGMLTFKSFLTCLLLPAAVPYFVVGLRGNQANTPRKTKKIRNTKRG